MQFDFNLAPGQSQTMDVSGRFFKYKSGNGAIRVRATGGGYVDLLPGQGVWGINFTSLTVTDKSGAANAGVILAGEYDFRDDRIVGQVEVIDGGRTRTVSNVAYLASVGLNPLAANYSFVELWNPVGSGKNLVVESVYCSAAVAGFAVLKSQTAALGGPNAAAVSKKIGGVSATVALTYVVQQVADVGVKLHGVYTQASQGFKFEFVEPLVVMPGNGLSANGAIGQDMSAVFEFFDDPI